MSSAIQTFGMHLKCTCRVVIVIHHQFENAPKRIHAHTCHCMQHEVNISEKNEHTVRTNLTLTFNIKTETQHSTSFRLDQGKSQFVLSSPGVSIRKLLFMSRVAPLYMNSASFRAVLSIATALTALVAFFSHTKFYLLKQGRIRISFYNVFINLT
jgi:hypothetical protein